MSKAVPKLKDIAIEEPIQQSGKVKVELPANARAELLQNKQTVNIRIEPEHLGPARLSLIMNEGALRARVIVQSSQALAVIENSIEQLTDQLARADIKVDYIEVNVSSDDLQQNFYDRRPGWLKSQSKQVTFGDKDKETSESSTAMAIPAIPPAYIGTNGVNILA